METTISAEVPIACTLEAGEFKERIDWIAELNQAALLSARREGLQLILIYRRDHAEHVGEMLRREQRCCSFLGFDLTEDQGGVTLVIEAPEGAADALDAIFEPFLSASPRNGGRACSTTSGRKGANNDGC